MTQERNQPGQGGYPSSTQVPGTTNPEPVEQPWDPKREPQGAPMPWEKDTQTGNRPDSKEQGQDQPPMKR